MHEYTRIDRAHLLASCAALAELDSGAGQQAALLVGRWAQHVRPGSDYVAGDDLYHYCGLLAGARPALAPHAVALLRAVGLR